MASLQFVEPYRKPQPPDYAAIKRASDARLEAERLQAIRAAEKAVADAEAQRQAQAAVVVYAAPTQPVVASDVTAAIVKWANYYSVDPSWLLRVASCESGYNQAATNFGYTAGGGHPYGIFQFLPQTFYGNGGKDYESYDDQARVAAYMFSIGQSVQWECK